MKLTINTTQLQGMLNKAIKGAGRNKLKRMTELVSIRLKDKKLTLSTTDEINYLSITADNIDGDDMYVAVEAELFVKLVSKLTSDTTTLAVEDKVFKVIGNGTYEFKLEIDPEDGTPVVLPNPIDAFVKGDVIGTTTQADITNIIASIKSALCIKADYPWYCCYYVTDDVVASDMFTVGSYAHGFLNEPYLVRAEAMDLVGLLSGNISVYVTEGKMLFEAENGSVYTTIPNGIDKYDIDGLRAYIVQDFEHSCKITKNTMLSLLDRVYPFVGAYDNGRITLSFANDGLTITSKYAEETINYAEATGNVADFTCAIDIEPFTAQIKSQLGNVVEIQYGNENAIKIIDGDVISVISLLSE